MVNTAIDRESTVWKMLLVGSALPLLGAPGIIAGFALLLLTNAYLWIAQDVVIGRRQLWTVLGAVALLISCAFVYGAFFSSWS